MQHLDKDSTGTGHLSFFAFNQNPEPWPAHSSTLDSPEDQYVNENVKPSLKVKHTENHLHHHHYHSSIRSLIEREGFQKYTLKLETEQTNYRSFSSLDVSSAHASGPGKLLRCFCMNKTSQTKLQLAGNTQVKKMAGNPCQLPPTSLSVSVLSTEARVCQVRAHLCFPVSRCSEQTPPNFTQKQLLSPLKTLL